MNLFSTDGKEVMRAAAEISGKNNITGQATFIEYQFGTQTLIKILLTLSGDPAHLKPGLHAVHIHEKGTCEGEFKCAGGHFDPGPAGIGD